MKPIVLEVNDPRIGKATEEGVQWPSVDVTGAADFDKRAIVQFSLRNAPNGEHWFVVLPPRFDDGDLQISVATAKVVKPVVKGE